MRPDARLRDPRGAVRLAARARPAAGDEGQSGALDVASRFGAEHVKGPTAGRCACGPRVRGVSLSHSLPAMVYYLYADEMRL